MYTCIRHCIHVLDTVHMNSTVIVANINQTVFVRNAYSQFTKTHTMLDVSAHLVTDLCTSQSSKIQRNDLIYYRY